MTPRCDNYKWYVLYTSTGKGTLKTKVENFARVSGLLYPARHYTPACTTHACTDIAQHCHSVLHWCERRGSTEVKQVKQMRMDVVPPHWNQTPSLSYEAATLPCMAMTCGHRANISTTAHHCRQLFHHQ